MRPLGIGEVDVVLDFSFVLPEERVTQYFDGFEAPTPDEGPLTVVD